MSRLPPEFQALQQASRNGLLERVRELLDQGVDQNTHPGMPKEMSPLMYAAWKGHRAVVRLLVERGADVNFMCGDGFTALTLAAWEKHWDIVRDLAANGGDVSHRDARGTSGLIAAEKTGDAVLIERFAPRRRPDRTPDEATDPLPCAARMGNAA